MFLSLALNLSEFIVFSHMHSQPTSTPIRKTSLGTAFTFTFLPETYLYDDLILIVIAIVTLHIQTTLPDGALHILVKVLCVHCVRVSKPDASLSVGSVLPEIFLISTHKRIQAVILESVRKFSDRW